MLVNRALERRTPIVELVDRAGERDKCLAKVVARLTIANVVLDLPELRIDAFQFVYRLVNAGQRTKSAIADGCEGGELAANVAQLSLIAKAFGLDLEDRDAIEELARRDLDAKLRRSGPVWPPATLSLTHCPAEPARRAAGGMALRGSFSSRIAAL